MKKQKTILIDFEVLLKNPAKPFNAHEMPLPKENIEEFLQLLCSKYKLILRTKNYITPLYIWCETYGLTKYFISAVSRKKSYFLKIPALKECKIDIQDIVNSLYEF